MEQRMNQTGFEKERVFKYLDELRESGKTNMYGAAPYIRQEFGTGKVTASELLKEWMETYEERHPADE